MGRRRKNMEQERLPLGTISQTREGGNYYLRYQIHGRRKNVNLNTDDYDKTLAEYKRLLPTPKNEWRLAPAYDLTPCAGLNGEHTAMVNGKCRDITAADLIVTAATCDVS